MVLSLAGGEELRKVEEQITIADAAADQQPDTTLAALSQRRHVISQRLTFDFAKYLGLALARADATRAARTAASDAMRRDNEAAANSF